MKRQFKFPDNYLYYSAYVWVEDRNRGVFRIGITDFGQFVLDDIISVSLPETGILVERDEEIVSVDSIEGTLIIRAPITGQIVEINEELRQSPELLNESPYNEGWIVELEIDSDDDLDKLMDSNEILDVYQEELSNEELEDEEEEEEEEESKEFDDEEAYEYSDNITDYE